MVALMRTMRLSGLRCLLVIALLMLVASAAAAEDNAGLFNPPTHWPPPATGSDTCLNAAASVDHQHTNPKLGLSGCNEFVRGQRRLRRCPLPNHIVAPVHRG